MILFPPLYPLYATEIITPLIPKNLISKQKIIINSPYSESVARVWMIIDGLTKGQDPTASGSSS